MRHFLDKHLVGVVITVTLMPPIALVLLRGPLNRWYSEEEGVITALLFLFSFYLLLVQLFYLKSERFYLWVQRIRLYFRHVDTAWRFTVRYEDVRDDVPDSAEPVKELLREIDAEIDRRRWAEMRTKLCHSYGEWVIDDRDRLRVDFDFEENAAIVTTSRILVPSYRYTEMLDRILELFAGIERVLRIGNAQYRLEISFPTTNPYFGYFIRHVPRDVLRYFRCVFQIGPSRGAECTVEATQNEIYLSAASRTAIAKAAIDYLTLSASLTTKGYQ